MLNGDLTALAEAFHQAHARVYGHVQPGARVQFVNLRMVATGRNDLPHLPRIATAKGAPTPLREISCWISGRWRPVALYARADLCAGHRFAGPAVIAQDDMTTFVPEDCSVEVDAFGDLRVGKD